MPNKQSTHILFIQDVEPSSQPSPWKLRKRPRKEKEPEKARLQPRKSRDKTEKTDKDKDKDKDKVKDRQSDEGAVKRKKPLDTKETNKMIGTMVSKKPPSYKTVVQLLTTPIREEEKCVTNRQGLSMMKMHLVYQCPNEMCKEKNREIWFQKSMGFVNPFNHLKSCIADGNVEQLYLVYEQNLDAKRTQVSGSFFQPSADRLTTREISLNDYLRLIVLKNLPVSIVEDPEFRSFHKYNETISKKALKEVVFKLVDIVDKKLGSEMKQAGRGSILHDGWTCAGVHYIGLFACYVLSEDVNGVKKDSIQLSLLSVSPMARTESGEDSKDGKEVYDETAVNFNAETCAEHIRNIFRYYGLDVEEWAVCQMANNCSVNLKVADLLGIPHVACKNHLLNLEVNEMVKQLSILSMRQ